MTHTAGFQVTELGQGLKLQLFQVKRVQFLDRQNSKKQNSEACI